MRREYEPLWEKCAAFHGHECGGLAVGFQAALYAMELLGLKGRAEDEEIVCISENDACGVDAIQALLGCTAGKGNLIFDMQGKQAFSFFSRGSGEGVRLLLRRTPGKTSDERLEWLMDGDFHEMFDVKPVQRPLPEKARIFKTYVCAKCGESVAESHVRLQNGETVCLRCFEDYTRGL
ncbi:MAG TPA: TraR/DksA C4-type zinc finger protein [Candidatus Scatomorpha intestinavium]|uniref:TraR/DksA C4-type zinc finger protein n=1 Tax=Candidatus Scatomorpha intestinavium TaxID=2840922 RepID=A0A9D1CT74_9FIRM|nr:TraR/DksA C4-type zinc finger protein [Candidatus Scatomorpha intestinavium]